MNCQHLVFVKSKW